MQCSGTDRGLLARGVASSAELRAHPHEHPVSVCLHRYRRLYVSMCSELPHLHFYDRNHITFRWQQLGAVSLDLRPINVSVLSRGLLPFLSLHVSVTETGTETAVGIYIYTHTHTHTAGRSSKLTPCAASKTSTSCSTHWRAAASSASFQTLVLLAGMVCRLPWRLQNLFLGSPRCSWMMCLSSMRVFVTW